MSQQVQNFRRAADLAPRRNGRTINHNDRQVQCTRRVDLGARTFAASVLGHDNFDPVIAHQGGVIFNTERSLIDDDGAVGQRHFAVRCINQAQQIFMLGLGREGVQMHTPDRQHYVFRRTIQRGNGGVNIRNESPIIAGFGLPLWAGQRDQFGAGLRAGRNRICAHLRGKGVGRIDHVADAIFGDVVGQTCDAPKAADARLQGLAFGSRNAARVGKCGVDTCIVHGNRKRRGFGCAAKDQEVFCHV